MPGHCCRFCGHHCFLERTLPSGSTIHMASCARGKDHDRRACGFDSDSAWNPQSPDGVTFAEHYQLIPAAIGDETDGACCTECVREKEFDHQHVTEVMFPGGHVQRLCGFHLAAAPVA